MSSEINTLYVFAPLSGQTALVGKLTGGANGVSFTYAPTWNAGTPGAYPLDPLNLPLVDGPQLSTSKEIVHGVFLDAGPDSWGKRLIERERGRQAVENPLEMLRLTNGTGTGALTFSQSRTRAPAARRVTAIATLAALEDASRDVAEGRKIEDQALHLVFEHGSSLGGARPKAAVLRDDGEWIAKFGQADDAIDIPRLEWSCLALARLAGISVPDHELIQLNGRAALLVSRFDRTSSQSIHYLSLHSLMARHRVSAADAIAPTGDYTYAAAAALYRRIGVEDAGARMFERMLFNVRIGNTDDHARNHGLLYQGGKWDLAPAFDLVAYGGTEHSLGIGRQGRAATIENAMSAAEAFLITAERAREVAARIDAAMAEAPRLLRMSGMHTGDIDAALRRMSR